MQMYDIINDKRYGRELSDEQIAELDLRFEAMKPYLKEGSWK